MSRDFYRTRKRDIDDGWSALANAIVIQAADDYIYALKHDHKNDIESLERFFRSQWYRELTSVDGEYLIEQLRLRVKK